MRNTLVGWLPQSESPFVEADLALDAVSEFPNKVLLAYTPVARMNPYQALLYSACNDFGIAPSELIPFTRFTEVGRLKGSADLTVVHFHWINSILATAANSENAERKVDEAIYQIERLQNEGIKFAFTIHNKISHDVEYVESEIRLQQAILDASSAIHSMSRSGIDSMREFAVVDPAKVLIAPHPTYEGVYPNFLTKSECRKSLGLRRNEFVFSLFGALKAYKGLDLIRLNWEKIVNNSNEQVRLVVAGAPDSSSEAKTFVDWAIKEPSVIIQPTKIPFEQVQLYLQSADAGIIPYSRTLNSGSAMLHLTFGNPLVMTNEPALSEGIPSAIIEQFGQDESFVEVMLQATEKFSPSRAEIMKPAFEHVLAERSPRVTSKEFSQALLGRLGI